MTFLLGIPVYNEVKFIPIFFEKLLKNLPDEINEIIVINDGSTDGSRHALDEIKTPNRTKIQVIHQYPNQGYGAGIIFLMSMAKEANYDYLITMDCDLQHQVEDLQKFIQESKEIDVVSGSRYLPESPIAGVDPPPERIEINKRITAKLNKTYHFYLTDSFCGFKRYRLKNIQPEVFEEKGYAFPMEFWAYSFYNKLTIKEIPVARVYVTNDRSFGENLDRHTVRYHYYLRVLKKSDRKFQLQYQNKTT
ncbi:MAG: glycosyltransferase family 2 protein [Leptospiraceae bacterium]|nr:glycosyltransferase family 2 protein [Leptospiraceae bacterium]MDW7976134.1 glycosyltransferase family 2 protein [Leptospiraceae bacterium]